MSANSFFYLANNIKWIIHKLNKTRKVLNICLFINSFHRIFFPSGSKESENTIWIIDKTHRKQNYSQFRSTFDFIRSKNKKHGNPSKYTYTKSQIKHNILQTSIMTSPKRKVNFMSNYKRRTKEIKLDYGFVSLLLISIHAWTYEFLIRN